MQSFTDPGDRPVSSLSPKGSPVPDQAGAKRGARFAKMKRRRIIVDIEFALLLLLHIAMLALMERWLWSWL